MGGRPWRCVLAVAAVLCASASTASAVSRPLHVTGRTLRDASGRQVLLRGFGFNDFVEFAWNRPRSWAQFPRPGEIEQLAAIGANSLRVAIDWSEIEPQPGEIDESYLERIGSLLRTAHSVGVGVVLDFHQDAYGPGVGFDGAPNWSCDQSPESGPSATTQVSPGVFACWTEFWQNTHGAQTAFIDMLGRVAAWFRGNPALLGYDVLNEPNPGLSAPPGVFESLYLSPFYTHAVDAIRAGDPQALVFIEPAIYRDFYVPTTPLNVPRPNLVYAPHLYNGIDWSDSPPSTYEGGVDEPRLEPDYALGAQQAALQGTPWVVGEEGINFDGGANGPAFISDELNLADRYLVSHWWWDAGLANPAGFNLVDRPSPAPYIAAWSRPYAQATSGTLRRQSWDSSAHIFRLRYQPTVGSGADTEVFVPALQYPSGYRVAVAGGRVVSAQDAPILRVRDTPRAAEVRVTIRPALSRSSPEQGRARASSPRGSSALRTSGYPDADRIAEMPRRGWFVPVGRS